MRRRASLGIVVALTLVAVAAFGGTAFGGGRQLSATMNGVNENPDTSSTATGTFTVRLNPGQGTVCYDMTVSNLTANPTMAHIHKGLSTENGSVVIHLFGSGGAPAPTSTSFTITNFCQSGIDRTLIKDIIQNPTGYYVNVHTSTFPNGEIRGQLTK
ncbi:MAG TPA: CHRD domain-containing protein [Actinomycetota bacterium]